MASESAALLQALWETHAGRSQLQAEIRQATEAAGRDMGASRLVAMSQMELGRVHLERVIHWTLDAFEKRAVRDTATREFLTSGAARQVIAAKIKVDMPMPQARENRRVFATLTAQRAQHIAYLEHVADAHLQVLASSFASPPPDVPQDTVKIENGGIRTMTREELEKRDALRLLALRTISDATNGSTQKPIDVDALGARLGNPHEVMEAVRYLIAEHLLIWSGTRTVRLTHEGRREMEATLRAPNDPTEHFPVPAIQQLIQHFHGAVGVGAQTGGTSNVEQHIGSSSQEVLQLLAEIRAAIPETATDMLEAANDLQEEISKKTPKPSRLKAFVALLWAGATHIVEIAPKVLDLCDRLKLPRPPMPG